VNAPEVRLSPDGQDVAINIAFNMWKTTSSVAFLADVHVRDWTPLLPVSNEDAAP
jgi:hypothetical protein